MKSTISRAAVILFLTMGAVIPFEADDCPSCDCYQFPLPTRCEKCCSVATGTVTAVSESSIIVNTSHTRKKESPKKFVITPKTKKNGTIQKDSFVTVYYHREGNIAEQIDMVAALDGLLVPANQPDPPLPLGCEKAPLDAFRVYLGSSAGWSVLSEMTILIYRDTPLIRIRRVPKGIAVEGNLFEPDGRPGAVIADNRLYLNPDGYFRVSRPDPNTFDLYDKLDSHIMQIRFINPHSLTVLGKFDLPLMPPLVVYQNAITTGEFGFLSNTCAANTDVMLKITDAGSLQFGVVNQ